MIICLNPVGHETEIHRLDRLGEIRHRQLAVEDSCFHNHRQGLAPGPLQRACTDRKDKGPVRVGLVIDDPIGVVSPAPAHPFHLDKAIVKTGYPQDARVLVEPSRSQSDLRQCHTLRCCRVPGENRDSQGDVPLAGVPSVLEGHVGPVLTVLAQAAQIDGFLESSLAGDTGIGQPGAAIGHGRGGPGQDTDRA